MIYDSIDVAWSWDGDYSVGSDGDLSDTSSDYLLSEVQEIQTVVKSTLGDWLGDSSIGASLGDFVGEANTRENGAAIENRIRTKLVEAQVVQPEDLSVRVFPVGIHQLMIAITVTVTMTANNQLTTGQVISVNTVWDSQENMIWFLAPNTQE